MPFMTLIISGRFLNRNAFVIKFNTTIKISIIGTSFNAQRNHIKHVKMTLGYKERKSCFEKGDPYDTIIIISIQFLKLKLAIMKKNMKKSIFRKTNLKFLFISFCY
jgi:hypothetical protein